MSRLVLYNYWRSGPSYRVRMALALKGVAYEYVGINLLADEQRSPAHGARHPLHLVPSLQVPDGRMLTQSPAILEWLEETYPDPPLLPGDAWARAQIRAMAALIGCDIHPLQNLRVLKYLETECQQDPSQRSAWCRRWIVDGFAALETLIAQGRPGRFAWGDAPSLVDVYLLPQMLSARRFQVDLSLYPALCAIEEAALAHPAIASAHPDRQPDAAK